MKTARVLAVDLGASGGKSFVGAFDNSGFSMREIHRFSHEGVSFHLADKTGRVSERSYWNDVLIHQNIILGMHEYRRNVADSLDSIGIDTWGADGLFIDADGDPLGRMYTYRDHRLDDMVKVVQSRIPPQRIYEITGITFWPFNVSNQLCWFCRNRKSLLKAGAKFVPVASLFYYYLGGVRKVDETWASITQLMDVRKKRWSLEMLKGLGIPAGIMPEIVKPGKVIGRLLRPIAQTVGLNQAKLTAVGAHDTACAFAAAPADEPGKALIISSGTWSLLGKLIREPITTPEALAANMSNEGGIGNIRFLRNCMGTWLAQELRRAWRLADGRETSWSELEKLSASAAPFAAYIDPDDPGFYNPSNMETAIADFCRRTGQTPPPNRGSMLRTVYESLALKYRTVNELLCRVSGTQNTVVHVVGGGCRNELLNQFTANALGLPVVAGPQEATAIGNIMTQAMGLGIIRNLAESLPLVRKAFPLRNYAPQDTGRWNAAYETFRRLTTRRS